MPHAPDDDLLSALLDGEADEDFAAHVADCADCQPRLEALRSASLAVRTPVIYPAAHVREAAVARAVQTAHEPAAATTGSKLLRMSAGRRRDASPPARRMSSLSAAAVLVVVLGIGALAVSQLASNDSSRPQDFAATADAATPTAGRGAESLTKNEMMIGGADSASGGAAGAGDTSLAASAPSAYAAYEIGRFTSIDDVAKRASTNLSAPDADEHQSLEPSPCPLPEGTQLLWHATLYFQNTPAIALVRTTTSSQWVLEIRSPAASGCGLLATQEIAPSTPR